MHTIKRATVVAALCLGIGLGTTGVASAAPPHGPEPPPPPKTVPHGAFEPAIVERRLDVVG